MNRTSWRFISGALALVVVAVGVLYLVDYIRYRRSPEYRVERGLKELERQYREDKYGGDTPEETLRLFIDALKKGDVELASKYFAVDEQKKWRENLTKIKEEGSLKDMIRDLKRDKFKNKISDGQVTFSIANDQNRIALTILLGKGPNGLWKILDL